MNSWFILMLSATSCCNKPNEVAILAGTALLLGGADGADVVAAVAPCGVISLGLVVVLSLDPNMCPIRLPMPDDGGRTDGLVVVAVVVVMVDMVI